MNRIGDWMQTISGTKIWPLDPRVEEINLYDIAHALSMICRFNGHCLEFYSVAQHSVYVSEIIDEKYAKWGLLHDASEAFIADIVRPAKRFMPEYKEIEKNLSKVIYQRFGLDIENEPSCLKEADNTILALEARKLMRNIEEWNIPHPKIQMDIECLSPIDAKNQFLRRAKELGIE